MSRLLQTRCTSALFVCWVGGASLFADQTDVTRDEVQRITQVENGDGTRSLYTYDANGNRLSRLPIDNNRTITVTVDPPNSGTVTGAGPILFNTQAVLSATPAGSFVFSGWYENNSLASPNSPYTFTVNTSRTLVAKFVIPAPEIVIEDTTAATAVNLTDGSSTLAFGHPSPVSRTLTVRNIGTAQLTGLSATLDGVGAGFFSKSSLPATLSPGSSVTLTLQFTATSPISTSANLHVLSNDADEASFDLSLNGTVECPGITITAPASTLGIIGTAISRTFTQSGGVGAITFSLASGSLPSGISLSTNGILAGTPTQTGIFPITVLVTDNHACTGTSGTYTLMISNGEPDGALNTGFGAGGRTVTHFGSGDDIAFGVVLQPDGKAVAAGYAFSEGKKRFALARYTIDGSLDASFGSGGKVITSVSSGENEAHCIALQSDGKIIAAGYTRPANAEVALVRYHSDGSIDTTFGTGGKVSTPVAEGDDDARAILIQPDGKIVVVGYGYRTWGTNDLIVLRYNPDGGLDDTFATDGKLMFSFGDSYDTGFGVALQHDGKIVAVGATHDGLDHWGVARITSDGMLDSSFNGNGKVITSFGTDSQTASSVALQSDGKIVVGGDAFTGIEYDFALARYNTDGSLDASFGTAGKVTTDWDGRMDSARSLAVQMDGRILLAGIARNSADKFNMALARYLKNGTLDQDFGTGGKTVIPVGTSDDRANALALLPSGSSILVGQSFNGSDNDFAIAKVHGSVVIPDIEIEVSPNTAIAHGATVHLGSSPNGSEISKVFTIKNIGNSDLLNLSASIDGPDAQMFAIASSPSSPVPPGSSTALTVRFSPTMSGTRTATLHIASNDVDENPFDLALSGEALPATVSAVRFSDHFASPVIDASKWTASGNSVSVSGGIMRVEQNQTDAGGTLVSIPISVGSHQIISISRKANLHYANSFYAALMRVSIGTLPPFGMSYENYSYVSPYDVARFGFFMTRSGANAHAVAGQADTSVAIPAMWDTWFKEGLTYNTDTGIAEYFINDVSMLTYNVGVLPATANPTMTLSFGSWGWFTGHHHWFDDLVVTTAELPAGDAAEIAVEDSSAAPPISLADGASILSFGSKAVPSTATKTLTLYNAGRSALTGLSALIDGASSSDFSTSALPASIDAGGSAVLTVGFTPTAQGVRSAALHIASNDSDESPFDLALSGIGYVAPFITAHPVGGAHGRGSSFALTVAAAGGGPLSYRWTLNGQTLPDTESSLSVQDASFLNAGTYAVEVTGDSGTTRSQSALITIPLDSYATWQSKVFTQAELNANDPAVIGKSATSESGGIANLIHYAMGNRNRRQLPEGAFGMEQGTTFHYNRLVGGGGLSYNVEFSRDLLSWESAGTNLEEASSTAPNPDGVTEKVSLRLISQLQTELGKAFFRIRLEEAEMLLHANSFNYCDGTDADVSPNVIRSEVPIPGRFEDTENGIRFRASFFRSGGAILTKSSYVPAGRTFEFLWDGSGGGSFMQPVCGFTPNQWLSEPNVDNGFVVCDFGNVWSSWLASPGTAYKTSVSFTATMATLITTNAATGQELDRKTRSGDFTLPMRPYLRGGDTYNFNDAFLRLQSLKIGPAVGPP